MTETLEQVLPQPEPVIWPLGWLLPGLPLVCSSEHLPQTSIADALAVAYGLDAIEPSDNRPPCTWRTGAAFIQMWSI